MSQLIESFKKAETLVMPNKWWEGQKEEIEGRKKKWKVTVETNAMAAVFKQRSAQLHGTSSSSSRHQKKKPSPKASASSGGGGGGGGGGGSKSSGSHGNRWMDGELSQLAELVEYRGTTDWAKVAEELGTGRTPRAVSEKWTEIVGPSPVPSPELGGASSSKPAKFSKAPSPKAAAVNKDALALVKAVQKDYRSGPTRRADSEDSEDEEDEENARENALLLQEEALKPRGAVWHVSRTADGHVYYLNATTGESSWTAPAADYMDVVTEKERMVWRDAAYAERFREQDLAEEEAQQVALMESHGMGEAPLSSDDMEDVEEDDDSDDEDDPQPEEERPARPSSRGSEPPQSALV